MCFGAATPFTLVAEPGGSDYLLKEPGSRAIFFEVLAAEMSGLGIPVPDDVPPVSASQLPWRAIPKFTPGVTNVQDYVRKLKFLASIWPPEHLDLLAPRAALQVEGSAFTAVSRLDGAKLRVKTLDGVSLLVETLGGQWGSTGMSFSKRPSTARPSVMMSQTTPTSPAWRVTSPS